MNLNPYLFFDGQCGEAFRFYAETFGARLEGLLTHGAMNPNADPKMRDRVVHVRLMVGETVLMGSDSLPGGHDKPQGLSVALGCDSAEEAERVFAALAQGGKVDQAMEKTFFAERFGACTDRFGTPWMVTGGVQPVG